MSDPAARLNTALEGRYTIERELGEGGMATVYLARDLKHNRNVALKVLKPELAAVVGAERFLAEIETTANLQHPHILPLFDSGEADGFLFYVMPYVEGETLRDRISREKQLPVDDAVRIASAVANALQHAHDRGVIHRDIKPANILIQDGEPVVADFGIALAVGAAGGSRLTETGLSVGTPYYMSPEQATGDQVVGPASDTYALACVLYEMLVGDPPYMGSTAQAVLGKIIQGESVSATTIRKSVPANVDAAIRKALEKLPADRFMGAQEFVKALTDPGFRHGSGAASSADTGESRWKRIAMVASGLAVIGFAMAGWTALRSPSPGSDGVTRHRIAPHGGALARPIGRFTALAPDGSSMVYAESPDEGETWELFLKPRNSPDSRPVPGTAQGYIPTYSPDSEWIAFVANGELKKVRLADGTSVTLGRGVEGVMVALAWLDDGTLIYELPGNVLVRIPEAGAEVPDTIDAYGEHGFQQLSYAAGLPGSKGALITLCPAACGQGIQLSVVDFATDSTRELLDGVARGWYVRTGHLIYVRQDGSVFAAPFDTDALDLTGPGVPLFDQVPVELSSPELAVGQDGTVLYSRADLGGQRSSLVRRLRWVDRDGQVSEVAPDMSSDLIREVALAPTDDFVALTIAESLASVGDIEQLWVKELPDGPLARLTTGPNRVRRPVWLPDAESIAYTTSEGGLHARTVTADGSRSGDIDVLIDYPSTEVFPTPDGRGMLFRVGSAGDGQGEGDIGYADLQTEEINEALLATEFHERSMTLSPDGQWMAYASNASGQDEVFVRPFPDATSRIPVSRDGGFSPVWAHNGRELFYVDGDGWLTAATYQADGEFRVIERTRLFDTDSFVWSSTNWQVFDVASDDERFLFMEPVADQQEDTSEFVLIQHFFEELERIAPQ